MLWAVQLDSFMLALDRSFERSNERINERSFVRFSPLARYFGIVVETSFCPLTISITGSTLV